MDLQRPIPANLQGAGLLQAHKLRDELAAQAATIGATCLYIRPGTVDTDITLEFDGEPNEVALDAALAAYPAMPADLTSSFEATANVPEHVQTVGLKPGERVGLKVTLAVSLAGASSRDGIIEAIMPVWREQNGTINIERPVATAASRVPNVAIEVSVAKFNGVDIGVAISYTQRASGTVTVLHLAVDEIYRRTLP